MFKKIYSCLSLTLMLATTAGALSPALPANAYVRSAEQNSSVSTAVTSGKFTVENGMTFCKNDDGTNRTGWVSESGSWYYFDLNDGHMKTGWIKDKNKWFYLCSKDGHMVTGWLVLNPSGKKYYLNKNGSLVLGPGWATIGGSKYYFAESGEVKDAWELDNGKWYYHTTDGVTVKNRWLNYKGQYYYLTADGSAAAGTVKIEGQEYNFNKNCQLLGSVPASVVSAAKVPLTSTTLKSVTVTTDTEVTDTAEAQTKTPDTATDTNTAAITSVVGKLNDISESRKQFVIQVANYVRKYAPQYGIKVYSPIIAQAIHESGWGESSLSAKYHNYFGLKCGTKWTGKSVNLSTKEEYSAGTLTTISANFRAYDSMEEGIKGYFEFIQLSRYANLKGVTSPRQYLQNIKNDGYATGSQYVDHTMALIELYNLTQFDN